MKKILPILTIVITLTNLVHAQDNWVTYKIDDKLSVKLPTQPTNIGSGLEAHTKDSLICFVSVIEADSTALAKMVRNPDFANGLKNSLVSGQNALTLGDMNSSKWNGYYCYDVDGINSLKKLKVSIHSIVIGGKIYVLGAMVPDGQNIDRKNIFFDSLKLN